MNWQKSSFSGGGDGNSCVEIASSGGRILIRESDNPHEIITTDPANLQAFILGVKAGEFDHLARAH